MIAGSRQVRSHEFQQICLVIFQTISPAKKTANCERRADSTSRNYSSSSFFWVYISRIRILFSYAKDAE